MIKRACRYILAVAGTPVRRHEITDPITTIGRSADCAIRIDEPSISRLHAEVQITPEGCQITNCSANGTLVNNRKITTHILQSGDKIAIGSTVLTFSVEKERSWILPQRAAFRCVQLTLVSALFCAVLLGYPLDKVATYWGDAWDDMIANARAGMPSPTVTEARSPRPEIRNQPLTRKLSPESVAREAPPGPDRPERANNFEIRSRGAVETLRKNVMDDLAAKDLDLAEVHLESFKKGEFYHLHLDAVQEMEGKIAAIKRGKEDELRRHVEEIETLWAKTSKNVDGLVNEEKFREATAILQPLLTYKEFNDRARMLMKTVMLAEQEFAETTMPERRALLLVVLMEIRSFAVHLDFDGALGKLQEMKKDVRFQKHQRLLTDEESRLRESGLLRQEIAKAIRQIPKNKKITVPLNDGREVTGLFVSVDGSSPNETVWTAEGKVRDSSGKETPIGGRQGFHLDQISAQWLVSQVPEERRERLAVGNFFLYAENFASAGMIVMNADLDLESADPRAMMEFFERHQLGTEAFRKNDLDLAIRGGDVKSLQMVKAKYEGMEENGEWRKELDGRLALANIADPSLKNLKPELARLAAKLDEKSVENDDLASRTKLAEEKIKAIKTLRIVADEKEIVPLISKGLDDQSSQVRMETCRIVSGVGTKDQKIIWKIVKLLDDPLPQIGEAVAETLTKLKIDSNLVKAKAKSSDGDDRRICAVLAGALRDKTYGDMLKQLLKDPLWQVRKASAVGLAKIGDKGASSALLTALKAERNLPASGGESPEVQVALGYALAKIDSESAIPALVDLLTDNPHHRFKRDLLRYIGEIGGPKAAVALKPYLRDESEWIRFQAAEGMSKTGVKPDMDDVKRLLVDDSWIVRGAAARMASAEGKGEKLAELLVRLLDDKDAPVRGEAVVGLERWREERVIPMIVKEIPALGGEGQKLATGVLGTLTGQKLTTKEEWDRWWNLNKGTFRLLPVEKRHEIPKDLKQQ